MPDFIFQRPQFRLPEPFQLRIRNRLFDLSKPKIMGIINLTPDSFFEGSRVQGIDEILKKVEIMLEEGADMLDLGAVSSRPGASELSENEELDRLVPVLEKSISTFPEGIFSVDTFRTKVAKAAIKAGASLINDISGGIFEPEMLSVIGSEKVPFVLMHNRGNFKSMHQSNDYQAISVEVIKELQAQIEKARESGIIDIIIDPGFGFSKNVDQNFDLLRKLGDLEILDVPILVGISRKSMISKTIQKTAIESLNGTTALHIATLMQGAHILRVHDVKEAKETIQLFEKLCSQES
jgi:dihydropteroate synthase